MPSLAEGVAALTAHVTSGEVNAAKQYAVFPSFFFPMTRDSVASDGGPAAFDFVHRVNMIPSDAPQFALSASFVWSVYKDVLSDRVLPDSADPQLGFARRFAEAKANMGDGVLTPEEHLYFETSVLPKDLETPNAWMPVAIGPDRIKTLAAQLPAVHQQWLTRFNLLSELGEGFLESIHFEQLSLVVLRPWFDASVFGWRFWDLAGEPISDGGDPPRGKLPGLIGKIVLVRNLKMKLSPTPLPEVQRIVFRAAPGGGAQPAAPRPPVERLIALSGADIRAAAPLMLKKPLRSERGGLKAQIDSQKSELAREIGASEAPAAGGGSQKFHVPFSFDTESPRAATTASLNAATAARAAKQAERDQALARIGALRAAFTRLDAMAPRAAGAFGFPGALAAAPQKVKLQLDLATLQAQLPQLEAQLVQAQAEEARWSNALNVLNQLQAIQADQTCYVLALVCDRVSKAPDPDPSLFTRS